MANIQPAERGMPQRSTHDILENAKLEALSHEDAKKIADLEELLVKNADLNLGEPIDNSVAQELEQLIRDYQVSNFDPKLVEPIIKILQTE